MNAAERILEMWEKDSEIDRTEPGRELTNVPKLHSKYQPYTIKLLTSKRRVPILSM